MSRTGVGSHDRQRLFDAGALAYSEDEDAWVGTLDDVQVYLPGTPRLGVARETSSRADAVLGQLPRVVGLARDALLEAVDETERADWQCVEVRFFERDAKKSFSLTFVLASEAGAEWDVCFRDHKPVSLRRKIALW